MKIVLAYITAKDKAEAESLGRGLLEAKLAACINLLDGMQSWYWWEGKIDSAQEAVLVAKTLESKKAALLEFVQKTHSYSCPCVLFLPVDGGNPEYLKWLADSVG